MTEHRSLQSILPSDKWILDVLFTVYESENLSNTLSEIPTIASDIEFLSKCLKPSTSDISDTPDNLQQQVSGICDDLTDLRDKIMRLVLNTGSFRNELRKICKSPPKF